MLRWAAATPGQWGRVWTAELLLLWRWAVPCGSGVKLPGTSGDHPTQPLFPKQEQLTQTAQDRIQLCFA